MRLRLIIETFAQLGSNRTLKEQAIYGKVLRNVEDVRHAVGKFVEDYNSQWRV